MRRSAPVSPTRIHRYSRAGLLALVLAKAAIGFGQVIENPAEPLAKDAGRILQLTEVWRITDESGEFFFKYPHDLEIAEDGSIFLADAEQFLKFSPGGRFLKNLYKKGQGPGEIAGNYFYYVTHGRDLFIQDPSSNRFWRADLDGVFQQQILIEKREYRSFLGVLPDGFLFEKQDWPPPGERTGRLVDIPHTVGVISKDGSWQRDVAAFRPQDFLFPSGGMSWDSSIAVISPDAKLLYGFHGREYLIEVVDLAAGVIVRKFKRVYLRVPHVERDWEPDFRKKHGTPKLEFETDITNLYPVGDRLWVETSTDDKTKGRLIDVFDQDGRFVDSFYLGAGRRLMAAREDAVYCQEKNEDEAITIVKYRIVK